MKKIVGLLALVVGCGSQVVDFPEGKKLASNGVGGQGGSSIAGSNVSSSVSSVSSTASSGGGTSVSSSVAITSTVSAGGQGGASVSASVGVGGNSTVSTSTGGVGGVGGASGVGGSTSSTSSDGGVCLDCPEGTVCNVDGTCVCDGELSPDKDCEVGKTLLCHYPPGNWSNRHEICVGDPAVPAHISHGDTFGCCD